MGKRELLLVVAFVIAGAIVYQATAPPPAPGERSFSPGRILDNIRREVRGNPASADSVSNTSFPVDGGIASLKVTWPKGSPTEVTIIGEERADIGSELNVHSRAFDDAEAQRTAKATVLKVGPAADGLVATIDFPREGIQTATLTLRVPSRLQLRVDAARNRTRITNVAALELENGRSNTEIKQVKGRVGGNFRGGDLRVVAAGAVKFTTIGADVRLEQIAGETSMNMRGGNLRGTGLDGPIDMEATGVDIELEKMEKATGILRITSTGGSVSVKGLRTDARIDARSSGVDVVVDRAVTLAIYGEGGAAVEITPPPGGYQLDAVATDGDITVPEHTIEVTTTGDGHRAAGAIKGGGPLITLRASHGSITLRERDETEPVEKTEKKATTEKRR